MNSYDVIVDPNFKIRFPEKCIVCGKFCQKKHAVKASPSGFFGFFVWIFCLTKRYDIPCHDVCIKSIKRSLLKRYLTSLILVIPILFPCIYFHFSRWVSYPLILLYSILITAWQIKFPLLFEFTKENEKIIFSFKNEQDAKEFALLNRSIIQVSKSKGEQRP
jgi:hypothetical protein